MKTTIRKCHPFKEFNAILYVLLSLVMLLSCTKGKNLPTAILGKWHEIREDNKDATMEFYKDGTAVVACVQDEFMLTADYKFLDDATIKLSPGGDVGAVMGPQVLKVAVTTDTLTLKYPDGKIERYTRSE